jgi:molybdate transport system substrate-binding protein
MATRGVLAELAARYQADNGQAVIAEAGGGVDVARRVRDGEAADVVVLADNAIERLISDGALRAGTPLPDIATEEALKRAVLAAATVSYSTGPSGDYLENMFDRWGILEQLRERIVVPPPGVPVAQMVAEGRAELGFQQRSELMNKPGITLAGLLPPDIQLITTFSGAVATASPQPDAAQHLLDWLVCDDVADAKRAFGLEPSARKS